MQFAYQITGEKYKYVIMYNIYHFVLGLFT